MQKGSAGYLVSHSLVYLNTTLSVEARSSYDRGKMVQEVLLITSYWPQGLSFDSVSALLKFQLSSTLHQMSTRPGIQALR